MLENLFPRPFKNSPNLVRLGGYQMSLNFLLQNLAMQKKTCSKIFQPFAKIMHIIVSQIFLLLVLRAFWEVLQFCFPL